MQFRLRKLSNLCYLFECFADVACCEFRQLLGCWVFLLRQSVCLSLNAFLEYVSGIAGVSEVTVLVLYGTIKASFKVTLGIGSLRILVFPDIHIEDLAQFARCIVWEVDVAIEARFQSGVGVYESVHLFGISGYNHHQFVAVVLHTFQ